MLKKVLLLPTFIFGFLAISSFVQGSSFFFFAWLFLALLFFVSVYPLTTDMDEKLVPVFHIITSLVIFVLFAVSVATLDFHKAGFPLIQSAAYGLSIGLLLIAAMMILKGK
jgi:hypothetical protein